MTLLSHIVLLCVISSACLRAGAVVIFDPDPLLFDSVEVGLEAIRLVTVTNTGSEDIRIDDLSMESPQPGVFRFDVVPPQSIIGNVLRYGDVLTLRVYIRPLEELVYEGRLVLRYTVIGTGTIDSAVTQISGRGVPSTSSVEAAPIPSELSVTIYPDPSSATTIISVDLEGRREKVEILVFDVSGRVVSTMELEPGGGSYHGRIDHSNLPTGRYLMVVLTESVRPFVRSVLKN